jgi:2-polyprenyl-3-methyl-5-hydroxy-6-metoxy-1,4-benzoquinol methylase
MTKKIGPIRRGEKQKFVMLQEMQYIPKQKIGTATAYGWHDDPRRLVFMLSRYKFVAKMLEGANSVLEIGCGDGFGTRIVSQVVGHIVAVDFDPDWIRSAIDTHDPKFNIVYQEHDLLESEVNGNFDAAYSLDVLEHIQSKDEDLFLKNSIAGLKQHGVMIVGMPSIESQIYASEGAKRGHVNCKTQCDLRSLMLKYFHNVFMFSANDEVIHTGYSKMAHYNLALCSGKRQ